MTVAHVHNFCFPETDSEKGSCLVYDNWKFSIVMAYCCGLSKLISLALYMICLLVDRKQNCNFEKKSEEKELDIVDNMQPKPNPVKLPFVLNPIERSYIPKRI